MKDRKWDEYRFVVVVVVLCAAGQLVESEINAAACQGVPRGQNAKCGYEDGDVDDAFKRE